MFRSVRFARHRTWLAASALTALCLVGCSESEGSTVLGIDAAVGGAEAGAGAGSGNTAGTSVPLPAGSGAGAGAGATGSLDGGGVAADGGTLSDAATEVDAGPRFPAVTDLSKSGPFTTKNANGDNEGPNCSVHRPATLGEDGLRHPVIIWGMGTGGFNFYQPAFDLWASHGFIVVAGLSGNGQGSGQEMLGCLDYVCKTYAPHVDCRAGASGHSQGGGGAIMAGQDPRVITTAPVQPYIQQGFGGYDQASIPKQTGPMLLLSGSMDIVATPDANQKPVYDKTNVPVIWATAKGVDHVAPGTDGLISYRAAMLGWFRVHLMGDDTFRGMFYGPSCELCTDSDWTVERKGLD